VKIIFKKYFCSKNLVSFTKVDLNNVLYKNFQTMAKKRKAAKKTAKKTAKKRRR